MGLVFSLQSDPEPLAPVVTPAAPPSVEELEEVVSNLGTVEEVLKYLDPERWRADMEELYRPSWHGLGRSYTHNKKTRGRRTQVLQENLPVETGPSGEPPCRDRSFRRTSL